MRSRTIREGSVGLLVLLGVGLFGLILLWLRGFNPGSRSYRFTANFIRVEGMQSGAPVRYRGVAVGEVTRIIPSPASVDVEMQVTPATLTIPRDAIILVNQSGLIGETSIDILPLDEMQATPTEVATNPLATDCPGKGIVCDGDRLQGQVGVSFNELIRATISLADLFGNEEFFNELRSVARNTSDAAAGVAVLSREVTQLSSSLERELTTLTGSASATTLAIGRTADQFGLTAAQINTLLDENRDDLSATLGNINATTIEIRNLAAGFAPVVQDGEFIQSLGTLSSNAATASANAAAASQNLLNLSESLGNSENILLLQQTLESARATFQNAQKITADLDELTGDPELRYNIRQLLDGLSNLVSYTEQLQQQTQMAETLTTIETALELHPTQEPQATGERGAIAPSATPNEPVLLNPHYSHLFQPTPAMPSPAPLSARLKTNSAPD
ncbi:MAG: MCE family protein [Leptolyngbyaceae cyanobacterium SL_7_1]|nr:MCE family protein [Leptolyngbyaceae cyanobacterium SL_7_1]